jgi:hypothetical protein
LNGRNVLVGIERGEAEYPAVFDYGKMSPTNVPVWDFVKLEVELKVRLLRDLSQDPLACRALSPGPDTKEDVRRYLDPERAPVDVAGRAFPAGKMAFAFWFEQKMAELSRLPSATAARGVSLTGNERINRALTILLRIRREANLRLGSKWTDLRHAHRGMDEYYFALVVYSAYVAKLVPYDEELTGFALVSGGVAAAHMETARNAIEGMIASKHCPRRPYPSYRVPVSHAYSLWKRGTPQAFTEARAILASVHDEFGHAVPFVREYTLALAAQGRHREARALVEPLGKVGQKRVVFRLKTPFSWPKCMF